MAPRSELHQLLKEKLGSDNVYFQPPPSVMMNYPAILYKRDIGTTRFADDLPYARDLRYMVTVIDRDPDSEIPDRIAELPRCSYSRHYTVDNLNHDVFNINF